MDLTTKYLGLTLAHPFMPGASPLDNLDSALRLEDCGASAIVMRSLFAEQLSREATLPRTQAPGGPDMFSLDPDLYLRRVHDLKRRVSIPVIASLNGTKADTWLRHARLIEQAGADALELNFFHVATDVTEDARAVESRVLDIVAVVGESTTIPFAVKLTPSYSALPHLAREVARLGASGLVLFNRLFERDLDLATKMKWTIGERPLSGHDELQLRLRWLAVLHGRVPISLAASGGVHHPKDAIKAILAGADVVQVVSALYGHGLEYLARIRSEVEQWGDANGYSRIAGMRGVMSLAATSDPETFERQAYIRSLERARRLLVPAVARRPAAKPASPPHPVEGDAVPDSIDAPAASASRDRDTGQTP